VVLSDVATVTNRQLSLSLTRWREPKYLDETHGKSFLSLHGFCMSENWLWILKMVKSYLKGLLPLKASHLLGQCPTM
jgi:hypothetical protein